MIYIDSSCLLKLLLDEPESHTVRRIVREEDSVIISILAELEAEVQLQANYLSGAIRASQWREFTTKLSLFRDQQPFQFRSLPSSIFQTALRQHRRDAEIHCRTLDRLHLAAMEELGLNRLLTTDALQAKAARGLGFQVIVPEVNPQSR